MSAFAKIQSSSVFFFYLLLILLPVQLGRHFWPSDAYVFGIRIDYLSPTFYLTDFVIFLLLILWAKELLFGKTKFLKKTFFAIFCFPVALLISAIVRESWATSIYYVAKIFEMSLLSLFVASKIDFKKQARIILGFLSVGVFWQSLLAIFQFLSQKSLGLWILGERSFSAQTPGISLVDLSGGQYLRPYGTFPHPNLLGGFLAVTIPALLILLLVQKKKSRLLISALLLGFVALALTFSRTSWLVGFGLSLLIVIKFVWERGIKASRGSILTLVGTALVLLFAFPFFVQRVTSFSTTDSHSLILRLKLTSSALSMLRGHPLFGVGPDRFLLFLPGFFDLAETIRWIQPVHNIFLLVAAEAGIFGLISFIILFFYPIFELFKRIKKDAFAKIVLLWFLAIYVLASFDHYFLTLQQGQLIFWIFLGLSWAYLKSERMDKTTSKTVLE